MIKKVYLLLGVVVILIALIIGGRWYWQKQKLKVGAVPEEQELSQETDSLSQDILDLETLDKDDNLNTLEEDLSAVAEETPSEQELPSEKTSALIDASDIENLEKELDAELDGISDDLTDLKGYEGDTSLNNLDDSLSGISQ